MHYRTFRNTDPPGLLALWNQSGLGRGAVSLANTTALEEHIFAKPYFDPGGLILAEDEDRVVGFAHAGFGPNESGSALSTAAGVVAMLLVAPARRKQGIGSELLRLAETYLQQRGVQALYAGAIPPLHNPFYFGLYGGSACLGIRAGDNSTAAPFLTRHGYRVCRAVQVLQRPLAGGVNIVDGRFPALRRRFEVSARPRHGTTGWWRESVVGMVEPLDFCLEEKVTGRRVAQATVWEMEGFSRCWNQPAVGLLDVEVQPELRRQGLGKFLLAQTLRYLQDQYFALVEVQVPDENQEARALFNNLGFRSEDTSQAYRKQNSGPQASG